MLKIPFYKPSIGVEEIDEVVATLKSGWLTTGPKTKQFEHEFGDYLKHKHAVAVNSCTAALHLALEAIGIKPGQGVIVPTMTFAATAEVVRYFGARPILVDCRVEDFNLDVADAERKIEAELASGQSVCAIIPVHYGGQIGDVAGGQALAQRYNLKVVEDAAHCCPAHYREAKDSPWRTVGSSADISCYSFYANKTITTGEGGMACTENDEYADRMRIMSLHGISRDAWKRFTAEGSWYYEITAPGYKYNLTDIAAAIGIHQVRKADLFHRRRTDLAVLYQEVLKEVEEIVLPQVQSNRIHSWHLFAIRLKLEQLTLDRAQFITELQQRGIGTSVHWMPLHMHPYYRQTYGYKPQDLPVACALYPEIITLPIYPDMTPDAVNYVCRSIKDIVAANRKASARQVQSERASGRSTSQSTKMDTGEQFVFQQRLKRAFDIICAALGILGLWPLGLLVGLLIKLTDRGPVFYGQTRTGQFGNPFEIWKFRSMVVNADKLGVPLTKEEDPRITWIGGFLRKAKLDELPQLWNVLVGNMSFVGPRPEMQRYVDHYTPEQREILKFKPGITDMATMLFRNEEALLRGTEDVEGFYLRYCLPKKIELNLQYAQNANLLRDIWIIVQTLCPYWLGVLIIYAVALAASFGLAYELHSDFHANRQDYDEFRRHLPWIVFPQLILLFWGGQLRGLISYFSIPELRRTAAALVIAFLIQFGLCKFSQGRLEPTRSLLLIDLFLSFFALCSVRMAFRFLREHSAEAKPGSASSVRRVAIIGTGELATNLALDFAKGKKSRRRVVAFFDDNPHTWHKRPHDIPVIGMPECLLNTEWESKIDEVIVALPEEDLGRVREIHEMLRDRPVKVTDASGWPVLKSLEIQSRE